MSSSPSVGRSDRDAAAGELAVEVELRGPDRGAARHRPENLELQSVRVLGVQRQADAMVRHANKRAGLDEPRPRPRQVGDLADLPGGVIHPRHALIGRGHAWLLEEAQMMVVEAARDLHEGRAGIPPFHLEAQHVAIEAHAALDVRHEEDEVLEPLQADAGCGGGHRAGYRTLTVMAAHAMIVSASGTRRPPSTGWTVTSPCGSSRSTRSSLTDAGSGTPTVTSTSMVPPRSRTSWSSGRLECRIASDTARHAALVESSPWTSTPMPNSSTYALALTPHLR